MRPDNDRSRRLGQTDGSSSTTHTDQARVTTRIAHAGDGADPHAIGELLTTWIGIQMDTVDDLVADARSKVDALPDQRQLWLLFGESLVRLHCLELEVAQLRADLARQQQRRRVA